MCTCSGKAGLRTRNIGARINYSITTRWTETWLWSRLLLRTRRRIVARLRSRRPCDLGGHCRVVVARERGLDLGHARRRAARAADVRAQGLALEGLVQGIQQGSRAREARLRQISANLKANCDRQAGATIAAAALGRTRAALQQMTRVNTVHVVLEEVILSIEKYKHRVNGSSINIEHDRIAK